MVHWRTADQVAIWNSCLVASIFVTATIMLSIYITLSENYRCSSFASPVEAQADQELYALNGQVCRLAIVQFLMLCLLVVYPTPYAHQSIQD